MPRLRIYPLSHLSSGTILPSQRVPRHVLVAKADGFASYREVKSVSIRLPFITTCGVLISLVAGIVGASAAETGAKAMPDSSLYPPPTPSPAFGTVNHRGC